MIGTLTYTGSTGPGQALTSAVFNNVTDIEFDYIHQVLRVTYSNTGGPSIIAILDLSVPTTFTYTLSGGVATITIS